MTFHQIFTALFLIVPIAALFFNKYFLIRKKIVSKEGKFCHYYVITSAAMIIIYNIFFLKNYIDR
jgi:hypothetical protein